MGDFGEWLDAYMFVMFRLEVGTKHMAWYNAHYDGVDEEGGEIFDEDKAAGRDERLKSQVRFPDLTLI